jgi:hypothetical protein
MAMATAAATTAFNRKPAVRYDPRSVPSLTRLLTALPTALAGTLSQNSSATATA